jgi:serine/threonine protein kinase
MFVVLMCGLFYIVAFPLGSVSSRPIELFVTDSKNSPFFPLVLLTSYHCQSTDSDSNIKIADFGFAKRCPKPNCLTTQCGTPGYVAPEILEGTPYDMKADMWSLGVIVYILLGGYPPFIEQNQRELFRKIRKGQYEFHEGKQRRHTKDDSLDESIPLLFFFIHTRFRVTTFF